jgi:hypothetical protein
MAVPAELQRYYEEVLATLNTPGWKFLTEDFSQLASKLGDVRNVTDLAKAKGQVDILDYVRALPTIMEKAYEEIKKAAETGVTFEEATE